MGRFRMGVLLAAGKYGGKAASPTKDTGAGRERSMSVSTLARKKEGRGLPALLALRWSGS